MPQSDFMSPEELMVEIYRAIYAALESRLHLIGSVIDADSRWQPEIHILHTTYPMRDNAVL